MAASFMVVPALTVSERAPVVAPSFMFSVTVRSPVRVVVVGDEPTLNLVVGVLKVVWVSASRRYMALTSVSCRLPEPSMLAILRPTWVLMAVARSLLVLLPAILTENLLPSSMMRS